MNEERAVALRSQRSSGGRMALAVVAAMASLTLLGCPFGGKGGRGQDGDRDAARGGGGYPAEMGPEEPPMGPAPYPREDFARRRSSRETLRDEGELPGAPVDFYPMEPERREDREEPGGLNLEDSLPGAPTSRATDEESPPGGTEEGATRGATASVDTAGVDTAGADAELASVEPTKPTSRADMVAKILEIAQSHVGSVDYAVKENGEPKGWQVIQRMFSESTSYAPTKEDLQSSWQPKDKAWCGIFVVWVYKHAGAFEGTWDLVNGRPQGAMTYEYAFADKWPNRAAFEDAIRPGDTIAVVLPELTHFAIFVSRQGNTLTTIDGNTTFGRIVRRTSHEMSKVVAFWSPLDPGTTTAGAGDGDGASSSSGETAAVESRENGERSEPGATRRSGEHASGAGETGATRLDEMYEVAP